ncbi:SPFH domain-containing protein [Roseofilum casamattae]|uniref:SPFH/Band 7/PHB domain protein n=1 Tax=Roseofilum casamattae BLCC-M143 TaxID=3022442 RepID=A0ABT7C014_9CYAN|nr:SPFH domain-containing protein [Roseofilum casamattae]MDJ1184796.1 SPFH/Band 7/PHB domain protein [Roseofilum casamattae BLCC-M143]
MIPSITIILLVAIAFLSSCIVTIPEPYQALVERFGTYQRTLEPGVNFIVPILDRVVIRALMSERLLDVPPQQTITKDNVSLKVDAIIYWQIVNLRRAYYNIDNVENALENLVLTNLRGQIGLQEMSQTFSGIKEINKAVLDQVDTITENWGIKLIRLEIRDITPPQSILDSLEQERAAESKQQASITEAQGGAQSIKILAEALGLEPRSQEFIQYLIAQRYLETNQQLTESPNSKVFFMNPNVLNENLNSLLEYESRESENRNNQNYSPSFSKEEESESASNGSEE